jgi:hypothetical protein
VFAQVGAKEAERSVKADRRRAEWMGFNDQGFGSVKRILKQEHLGSFIL